MLKQDDDRAERGLRRAAGLPDEPAVKSDQDRHTP
jgi:hypothetical protein